MQSLERIGKRIRTVTDLLSVVRTMKNLAAVNIRHFERAVESLAEFEHVVELGWRIFFRQPGMRLPPRAAERTVLLVLGSDQGMCGAFNETVLEAAREEVGSLAEPEVWAVGERVRPGLEDLGSNVAQFFAMPGTLSGAGRLVGELVGLVGEAYGQTGGLRLVLLGNVPEKGGWYAPERILVLPLDAGWAEQFTEPGWDSRCVPSLGLEGKSLLLPLVEQHVFVSLYGALVRSLAAENAARLASMQGAEKNIMDMRERLEKDFREARQATITGELLDIVSGFEAVMQGK